MDSALRHIGNIISKGGDGTEAVYLKALSEHLNAQSTERDINHVLDTINFLLSKAKTRMLGLQVLDSMLPWVSQDVLEQKFQLWTTFILKACNPDELQKYGSLIYKALTNLGNVLRQYAELSKSFASNHLTKIYEVITLSPPGCYTSALKCAEAYLSIYPKPNGQSREAMIRFLQIFPDKLDDEINYFAGRCWHFLQQTTVPGSKDIKTKEQWKSYQLQLIDSLLAMLSEAYVGGGDNKLERNDLINIPALKLSSKPDVRAAQLFVRFHNLNNYLRIAICEPNTASKPIVPKQILNLITHGLVVTCAALNQDATYSKIAFGVFIPKIQYDLLELSKALIHTLHTHLRIYYKTLLGCLMHVLKSTTSANKALRAQVYNVITHWCQTLREGSGCELYADELVPEILKDILPAKTELITQLKTKDKHRKLNKPLNTKETVSKAVDRSNQTLYIAPIKCLQALIASCSCFLKPTLVARIQMSVLKICASFFVTKRTDEYGNWQNRLEIYKLLHTLLMTPNQHSPPPSQIVLHILQAAQANESNAEIRRTCNEIMQEIEKIVHPQKESLIIPIEARTIRNAFIKLGQETLLEQSHAAMSALRYDLSNEFTRAHNGCDKDAVQEMEAVDLVMDSAEKISKRTTKEVAELNINGNSKQVEITEDDIDFLIEAPTAKKQRMEERNIQEQVFDEKIVSTAQQTSSETSDSSDDAEMETENLQPCALEQQPSRNVLSKSPSQCNGEKSVKSDNDQRNSVKTALPKNEIDEFAEMEACFVDELRGNF